MKAIRVIGCILAALQFVLTVLFIYMVYVTKLVPFKILVVLSVIMAILPIVVVLMQRGRKSALIGILISVIISAILVYGIYFIRSTNKALDDVTGNKTEVEQINVYVKKEDPATSINDAIDSNYIFAIVKKQDSEGVQKVIDQIG